MSSQRFFYKNSIFVLVFILSVFFAYSLVHTDISAQEEEKPLKQSEFIMHLVKTMHLDSQLPANPKIDEYIKLLETQGITMPGGYKPDEYITTKQMAIMLAPAMGMDKTKFNDIKNEMRQTYKDKATIIDIKGEVQYKQKDIDEWKVAKPGISLVESDTIKTGVDSKLILRVGEFGILTIRPETIMTLYNLAKTPGLYIEKGELILDTRVIEARRETPYYVITPTTVTAVRGTILRTSIKDSITSQLCLKGKVYIYEYYQKLTKADVIEKIYSAKLDEIIKENWKEIAEGYNYQKGQIAKASEADLQNIESQKDESNKIADSDFNSDVASKYLEK
jgi:hypothetical protein